MWFVTFIWKNLLRRPLRSILTMCAIAIAICAFVGLVSVSTGFERSFSKLYENAGVDLVVVRGITKRQASYLNADLEHKIRYINKKTGKPDGIKGVKDVIPGLMIVHPIPMNPDDNQTEYIDVVINGLEPETIVFDHLKIVGDGEKLKKTDKYCALLGAILAENLGAKVGSYVYPYGKTGKYKYKVVGIVRSNNVYENGGMFVRLQDLQEAEVLKDTVTGFSLILDDNIGEGGLKRIQDAIKKVDQGLRALTIKEHAESIMEIRMAKGMAWITSAIALLIGTFGVMNTMVMSVHERTREIGMLRAVGWRGSRVVYMVLSESVLLSIVGAIVGVVSAIGLVKFLTVLPQSSGFVEGYVSPMLILGGFGIAISLGLLGGSLPAIRAARLLPTEALRYE